MVRLRSVIVQQRIVELLAIQDVEADVGSSSTSNFASMAMTRARCSWVTMPFDNLDLAGALDGGLRQKALRLRAIEARMHAGDVVDACETRIQRGSTAHRQ
jgi:hypothetical protein